jgi:CheY-like chemotaxis protein
MHPLAVVKFADLADLVTGLVWPVLAGLIIWRLMPLIRDVIRSRSFKVNVAGLEISVQEASEALGSTVDDLRQQVSSLKADLEGLSAAAGEEPRAESPIADGVPRLSSVLWVDDFPENNAFEVSTLRRRQVRVTQVRTTRDALGALAEQPFDVVITDMGRQEDGPDAGLDLLHVLRERHVDVPVFVYASAPAVARSGAAAHKLGAAGVTSSATELLDMVGRVGLQ